MPIEKDPTSLYGLVADHFYDFNVEALMPSGTLLNSTIESLGERAIADVISSKLSTDDKPNPDTFSLVSRSELKAL